MKLKFIFFLAFINGLMLTSLGQTYVLKGIVLDSLSKEPLAFVSIYNKNLKTGTQSSSTGMFSLPMSMGLNQIKLMHVGCETKTIDIHIYQSIDTVLTLAHHQHELDNIIIVADKNKLIPLEKDLLKKDEIILSVTKPLATIMENLPGIYSLKTGSSISKPMIQGLYGSRVIVLNQGLKQEGQQWGQEHGLEIDPYNTEQITLIKGAETLRYTGDAIGGMILVEPIYNPKEKLQKSLTTTFTNNGRQGQLSASIEKYISKKFGFRIQASLKKSGDFKTPSYFLPNTGFNEKNINLSMRWNKNTRTHVDFSSSLYTTKLGILLTSHIGNLSDLLKLLNDDTLHVKGNFTYALTSPYQHITHSLTLAKWKHEFLPSLKIEASYGLQINQRKEYDDHKNVNPNFPNLNINLNTQNFDVALIKKIKQSYLIKTGLSGNYQTNLYQGSFLIPNFSKTELHHFALMRYKKKRNELEMGYHYASIKLLAYKWVNATNVRYPLNFDGWSWQMGWLYKISHDWQASLNLGKVWRNPNINEQFSEGLHHGAAAMEYGNSQLKAEKAMTITGQLKYRHNKTIFEMEIFSKHINNYIYLKARLKPELTILGAFPAFDYIQTNALFAGIDIFAEQDLTPNFSISEKIGILNAYDQSNPSFINAIPPYTFFHTISYKLLKTKRIKNTCLKLTAQQVLKQNRYTEGSDYVAPPNGYVLLNASFITNFLRYNNLKVFLTADNVLNSSYRNYLNRLRYYTDDIGRQITAGLNLYF